MDIQTSPSIHAKQSRAANHAISTPYSLRNRLIPRLD